MARSTYDMRRLICDLAVVLVGLWLGYFLTHNWRTMHVQRLVFIALGAVVCYAGIGLALLGAGRRPVALGVALAGAVAAGLGNERVPFALAILAVAALLRETVGRGRPAVRFVFGLLFAAAATCVGLVVTLPVSGQAGQICFAFACYIGLAEALMGGRDVPKNTFSTVFALMLATMLTVGALAMGRPYGVVSAAFVVWLGLRLIWSGRVVLRDMNAGHVRLYAESALLSCGFLAAALLASNIGPSEQTVGEVLSGVNRSLGEAAWPILCGVFSILIVRAWPYIARSIESRVSGESANQEGR
jgi:hypothetical protein